MGYLKLPRGTMSAQEKAYYALIEFRGAVQDYRSGESMRRAAEAYLQALNTCLKAGKEGFSHEMLFAGYLSKKIGQLRKAANLFADSAVQFNRERKLKLAQEMNRLAAACLENADRA